jgi:hypothetical protein
VLGLYNGLTSEDGLTLAITTLVLTTRSLEEPL